MKLVKDDGTRLDEESWKEGYMHAIMRHNMEHLGDILDSHVYGQVLASFQADRDWVWKTTHMSDEDKFGDLPDGSVVLMDGDVVLRTVKGDEFLLDEDDDD